MSATVVLLDRAALSMAEGGLGRPATADSDQTPSSGMGKWVVRRRDMGTHHHEDERCDPGDCVTTPHDVRAPYRRKAPSVVRPISLALAEGAVDQNKERNLAELFVELQETMRKSGRSFVE